MSVASNGSATSLTVTWKPTNPLADYYSLAENNGVVATWTKAQLSVGTQVQFIDTPMWQDPQYCYFVVANLSDGQWADSDTVCATLASGGSGNNTGNGSNSGSSAKPDLAVTAAGVNGDGLDSSSPKAGEAFTVNFEVCNVGTADVTTSFTDGTWVEYEGNTAPVKSISRAPLPAGQCYMGQVPFDTGLQDLDPSDQYYVYYTTDINNTIAESNVGNNTTYQSIWVDGP